MSTLNLPLQQDVANMQKSIVRNTQKTFRGQNLFTWDDALDGYNLSNVNGDYVELASTVLSGYIPIDRTIDKTLSFFSIKSITVYNAPVRALFFDKYKNSICSSYVIFTDGQCEIPANAAYIRFSFNRQDDRFYDAILAYGSKTLTIFNNNRISYKERPSDGNLIDVNSDICWGFNAKTADNVTITHAVSPDRTERACTTYIEVEPNTNYVRPFPFATNVIGTYGMQVFEFDKGKNLIRITPYTPIIKTSSTAKYLILNYKCPGVCDFTDKPFYLYKINNFEDTIGRKIAENNDVICYKTDDLYAKSIINTWRIIGLYENNVALLLNVNNALGFSTTGVVGEYNWVEINNTNFPNLGIVLDVSYVLFFKTIEGNIKCLVLFNNNQMYTSTDSTFTAFEECDIWDVKGNHNYHIADDDKDPTGQRYRAWLPSDIASRQNAFMWHNGPVHLEGECNQFSTGVLFGNYTNAYANNPAPSALYYTMDGKNIYKQYEFGVYQYKYKLAGDNTEKTSVNYGYGDTLDVSSFSGSITSVNLKKRWNILPTESEKNPTNIFEYGEAISVSAISGGVATLSDASSLSVGDTVILQGSATGDYQKILNNDASVTEGGQVTFTVKAISGNNVTLADSVGNPRNNLMCRHIHGVNKFGQGFCVFTGEEYPESWYIYFSPNGNTNTFNLSWVNHSSWVDSTKRLNSGKDAFQRSLGVYLRADGKVVWAADSAQPILNRVETADGGHIVGSNYGVHVFNLADIDNAAMSISKIPGLCAVYSLYYIAGVLFLSDYSGKTYYSKDEGDTWIYLCQDGTLKNILIGSDHNHRRFVFNNSRNSQFVIELK